MAHGIAKGRSASRLAINLLERVGMTAAKVPTRFFVRSRCPSLIAVGWTANFSPN
jgi:hypothetical protein